MQQKIDFANEYQLFFDHFSPKNDIYKKSIAFLHKLKKDPKTTQQFLQYLNEDQIKIKIINTTILGKYLRTLTKICQSLKSGHLNKLLGIFIIKVAHKYLPYHATTKSEQKILKKFARFLNSLQLQVPNENSSNIYINLFLQSKPNQKNKVVDLLIPKFQNQIFIDKKAKLPKNIKINSTIGLFIADNIQIFLPSLQRLLIRSQSNLEIWKQIFEGISKNNRLSRFAFQILKSIKEFLITQNVYTIPIVKSITSSIQDQEILYSCISLLQNLIQTNSDERKKLIIVQMFEGAIIAANNIKDQEKALQRIILSLIRCFSRINQETFFYQFIRILQKALEKKTIGTKQILQACKNELKGNKYALVCISEIISHIYNKQDLKNKSLLQISKQYEKLYKKSSQKIVTNIETYLASFHLLLQLQIKTQFSQIKSTFHLNNFNFLSIKSYWRDLYARIITKYLIINDQIPQQHNSLGLSLLIGLSGDIKLTILDKLSQVFLLKILTQGVYPYLYYDLHKIIPIKDQKLKKIVKYIITKIQGSDLTIQQLNWQRLLVIANKFKLLKVLLNKLQSIEDEIKQHFEQKSEKIINNILQKDFKQKGENYQKLNLQAIKVSFQLGNVQSLDYYLDIFTNHNNYKNIKCLQQFEQKLKESKQTEKQQFENELDLLKELEFVKEKHVQVKKQKKSKKNVEIIKNQDFKMLDENQVKQQKLKKHFINMSQYYEYLLKIVPYFLVTQQAESYFCTNYYEQLLNCMVYADLRFEFYEFNRILFFNETKFRKYSSFLAELFVKVGSSQIPKDTILEKFYIFQSDLLSNDFNNLKFHILHLFELVNSFLLSNLQFDVNLKMYSIRFYLKMTQDVRCQDLLRKIYPDVIKNINLLSSHQETKTLLIRLMKVVKYDHYSQIIDDILNHLPNSKKIILQSLIESKNQEFVLSFEDYVKMRVLQLDNDIQTSTKAKQLLSIFKLKMDAEQIQKFDLKRFIQNHSKETTEKLCYFAKQSFDQKSHIIPMFNKVLVTAEQLYKMNFDQQGLEFFPYFLTINIDYIQQKHFNKIFQVLIMQYTQNQSFVALNKLSLQVGIDILKKYGPKHADNLLHILQSYLKHNKGISNIVFLGVLAPYVKDNKNLLMIQKRITSLFESDNQNQQRAISKCMSQLMSFFKGPQQLIKRLYEKYYVLQGFHQVGQSYLIAGLLNGIGANQMMTYLNKVLDSYQTCKQINEKKGRLYLMNAFLDNHGRILETKIIQIMKFIIYYMSDNNQSVREVSKNIASSIMNKLSAYAVKKLLPELLQGLSKEENWRSKVTYIWTLGNMAHCAPKQLQVCLPKIVPTLSACLSDTHPKIRENATEALKVIGQTIKNPEIFSSIDILISALSDPFDNSKKGLEVLLKTRFSHYIDPPALSIIIPIVDYALRGRNSQLKVYASQVIGSISLLIQNPDDLLPYIQFINQGLRVTVCDPLSQIRTIATRALGKMSAKIGIQNTQKQLKFLLDILENQNSNSIERQGAAQGYSECICSHGFQYFQESLGRIYERLRQVKGNQKQGYISIFVYVPTIMKTDFEPFIKQVTQNMYAFVSDEDQSIRNSSLQVQKILINNFGLSHTQMLLEPLCDGLFEQKWRKRNGALILIGQMLNVLKNYLYTNQSTEKQFNYYQGLMGVYILKDDQVQMPRVTAGQVWNTYIDNTPKTLKMGLGTLVKMWVRGIKQPAANIALRNITGFSAKYGQTYFTQILQYFNEYLRGNNNSLKSGVYDVFCEFLKRLAQQFILKIKQQVRAIFEICLFTEVDQIRRSLVKALAIYVQKMHQTEYIQQKLFPEIDKAQKLNQQNSKFSNLLHLFGDLCSTSSKQIIQAILKKLMQKPLSQFKIQVITNNAVRLSNYLYTFFQKRPATQLLKDQIVAEINSNNPDETKLKSLIYCFNQISINLNQKHKGVFIQSLAADINVYSKTKQSNLSKNQRKILQTLLQLLLYFLNGTPPESTGNLEELIRQITPLAFTQNLNIINLINQIFSILFTNPNKSYASNYFKQFGVCLENYIIQIELKDYLPIWKDSQSAKVYITIFINSLVYSGVQLFDDTLSVLNIFFKYTPQSIIEQNILRIVGAVIRISNYRLNLKQKMKLQSLIQNIYERKFKIGNYQYQIQSTLLRLLSENRKEKQIVLQISSNFVLLLESSQRRNEILLDLIAKIHVYGQSLALCIYHIIKKVIKTDLISIPVYEKIFTQLNKYLIDKQTKFDIPTLYYLSKTSGRIASLLNKPWKYYQQLIQGITCPYVNLLQYLHYSYYSENIINDFEKINIFLRESAREKVLYLLKSLKLLNKKYEKLREIYSTEKTQKIISETILGFEEIQDMLKNL